MPADYRRLLGLIDLHGHADVMQALLRHSPQEVLDEWLGELTELRLIEPMPEPGSDTIDETPQRAPEIKLGQLELSEAQAVSAALARTGAYLATDRLAARGASQKAPADTVVLIVEDDPDQLALADLRVSMAGYQVRVAGSLKDFLQEMLDKGAPDLLLLDVELPDGDGFEILARLRRHKDLHALPIIMLTARSAPEDIGRGLVMGVDGYITKPYTKNILADVIRRVLKQEA